MYTKKLVSSFSLCTLLQACSSPANNASAKCMEQADLTYIQDSKHGVRVSPECINNIDSQKPTNTPSNNFLEKTLLEAVVNILDKSTNWALEFIMRLNYVVITKLPHTLQSWILFKRYEAGCGRMCWQINRLLTTKRSLSRSAKLGINLGATNLNRVKRMCYRDWIE